MYRQLGFDVFSLDFFFVPTYVHTIILLIQFCDGYIHVDCGIYYIHV